MNNFPSKLLFAIVIASITNQATAQTRRIFTVQVDAPAAEIQSTMWGVFFEDINFAADGGIYAELVKNRSFEFDQPLTGWKEEKSDKYSTNMHSGSALIINRSVDDQTNSKFAQITINGDNGYALTNEGFFGIAIKKDQRYDFSILARRYDTAISLRVELIDDQQQVLGSMTIRPEGKEWKKYSTSFTGNKTFPKAKLRIYFIGRGVIDVDMISMFPADTWKKRPGGLRQDLVSLLYDLKPGFLRFPGGCIVEGRDLSQRYQWKKTIGNVDDRELLINRWNTEFAHRPAPDYFQSFGLGFYEYFLLAEDLGASPLPILSCGMACQFNTAEVVPMAQLDPYIQDALDLIEFANGSPSSSWGKIRAQMGHPASFNLKMIGVGNEQWGPQYIERFIAFQKALKSKYPDIIIVSSAGPFSEGELFDYASKELKVLNAEIIDEHYYRSPEWFLEQAGRYDKYDRSGPKIFAGEYAAQSVAPVSPANRNNWKCALAEAAFMTGLERNADVVHLTSYAPLFAHAEGWQWTPDLIWFDNLNAYPTPNYHVQKLFSNNRGTNVLPMLSGGKAVIGQDSLFASAAWDKNTKEIILKIVNTNDSTTPVAIELKGKIKIDPTGTATVLYAEKMNDVNSMENPTYISPKQSSITIKNRQVNLQLLPNSFTVVKVKGI